MKTPTHINRLDLLQQTRRETARPGQRFADKSKYSRKVKHKNKT